MYRYVLGIMFNHIMIATRHSRPVIYLVGGQDLLPGTDEALTTNDAHIEALQISLFRYGKLLHKSQKFLIKNSNPYCTLRERVYCM